MKKRTFVERMLDVIIFFGEVAEEVETQPQRLHRLTREALEKK